jgi:translation elongation factor EF-4
VPVDELTQVVHETRIEFYARRLVAKIKEEMPRKQFRIAVQAKIGSRVSVTILISFLKEFYFYSNIFAKNEN